MRLGCRWHTDPPCPGPVQVWRRIIRDVDPVAQIGLCASHGEAFDRAVSRGGVNLHEELGKPLTVKAAM